jgi:hypothetical protein
LYRSDNALAEIQSVKSSALSRQLSDRRPNHDAACPSTTTSLFSHSDHPPSQLQQFSLSSQFHHLAAPPYTKHDHPLHLNDSSLFGVPASRRRLSGKIPHQEYYQDLVVKDYQHGKFPVILHQALLALERVGDTSIAGFSPDGKSFAIRNQYLFEKRILRVFFPKMKGFASFQRQLNLYDFVRIGGAGIDRGSYRHEMFHRDLPSKACDMTRTKIKGGKPRRRRRTSPNHASGDTDKE